MGKIKKAKARKEYTCSKCGNVIPKGVEYLRGERFRSSPVIRCTKCGIRSWELSTSEYVRSIGQLSEEWEEMYGLYSIYDITDELENIKSDCESSLDGIPYELQDGDVGTMLQERIDCIEEVISNLEDIDINDIERDEFGNLDDEEREEIAKLLGKEEWDIKIEDVYDELLEKYPQNESVQTLMENVEDEIRNAIEEAMSSLE